jgi:MYXO-CTERM domain-containing protein
MGRGFFFSSQALRHIDPPSSEKVWPDDVVGQVHADGEIIGGTLWDLRKGLIASLGEPAGVAAVNRIFYGILQMADDIPASFAAALIADDDDGNVDNGTPNECAIRAAFGLHGLSDMTIGETGISRPSAEGLTISVTEQPPMGTCPTPAIASARLTWYLRETQNVNGMVDMTSADLGGGVTGWSAALPTQADGTVIDYKVDLELADGMQISFPRNQADRYYELYVGSVVNVWCDDFETGTADQWTHGADSAADEWQHGAPGGLAGDPAAAFSGNNVFGTDIRSNGAYGASSSQWARTPEIDTSMYPADSIRLQYRRWLNVEDGFFDTGSISVDGQAKWSNYDSNQGNGSNVHHTDDEWRFHDVPLAAEAADNRVQVEFRLDSDEGLHFGGWTLDDVCIVARGPSGPVCGDGAITGTEQCDDGNLTDGDGCSATCIDETGGGDEGGCCSTGSGPGGPLALGLMTLGVLWRRRRK